MSTTVLSGPHLNNKVYIVSEILEFNRVSLEPDDGTGESIFCIDIIRFRGFLNKKERFLKKIFTS